MDSRPTTANARLYEIAERVRPGAGLGSRGYRAGRLVVNPAGGIDSEHSVAKLQDWLKEAVDG